jgi:hypothetical protein
VPGVARCGNSANFIFGSAPHVPSRDFEGEYPRSSFYFFQAKNLRSNRTATTFVYCSLLKMLLLENLFCSPDVISDVIYGDGYGATDASD